MVIVRRRATFTISKPVNPMPERWRAMVEAAKVNAGGEGGDVSREELEQLRALRYSNRGFRVRAYFSREYW